MLLKTKEGLFRSHDVTEITRLTAFCHDVIECIEVNTFGGAKKAGAADGSGAGSAGWHRRAAAGIEKSKENQEHYERTNQVIENKRGRFWNQPSC